MNEGPRLVELVEAMISAPGPHSLFINVKIVVHRTI